MDQEGSKRPGGSGENRRARGGKKAKKQGLLADRVAQGLHQPERRWNENQVLPSRSQVLSGEAPIVGQYQSVSVESPRQRQPREEVEESSSNRPAAPSLESGPEPAAKRSRLTDLPEELRPQRSPVIEGERAHPRESPGNLRISIDYHGVLDRVDTNSDFQRHIPEEIVTALKGFLELYPTVEVAVLSYVGRTSLSRQQNVRDQVHQLSERLGRSIPCRICFRKAEKATISKHWQTNVHIDDSEDVSVALATEGVTTPLHIGTLSGDQHWIETFRSLKHALRRIPLLNLEPSPAPQEWKREFARS